MAEGMRISISGGADVLARLEGRHRQVKSGLSRAMQKALAITYRRVQENLTGRVLRVQTGRLRQSIQTAVSDEGQRGIIGTNVEYAEIHEYGGQTQAHRIEARHGKMLGPFFPSSHVFQRSSLTKSGKRFTKKFLRNGGAQIVTWRRAVEHPGATIPARPWLRPALRDSMPEINELFRAGLAAAIGGK